MLFHKIKKTDIILISAILFTAITFFLIGQLINQTTGLKANIYVDNRRVQSINLHQIPNHPDEYRIFKIQGLLGPVLIIARHDAIKIEEVNCHHQICAAHGFVSSTIRPIVCLPNGIVIRLTSNTPDDTLPEWDVEI